MDIKQAQEKKERVEEQIQDLIVKFSDETGLKVVGLWANITPLAVGSRVVKRVCTAVTLDVEV